MPRSLNEEHEQERQELREIYSWSNEVERVTAERDALQAEVARLRGLVGAAYQEGFNLGADGLVRTTADLAHDWKTSRAKAALGPSEVPQ